MVNLHIKLIPRIGPGTYGGHEIVTRAWKIWPHGRQRDNISGNPAESVSRNSVSREGIANEARSAWIRTSRSRIVDRNHVSGGISPVRKIPVVHLRQWNGVK